MLKRSVTVFDELKQSVKDVQTLADPATGELRIGCPLNITVLPQFIERFSKRYPRVVLHVHHVPSPRSKIRDCVSESTTSLSADQARRFLTAR